MTGIARQTQFQQVHYFRKKVNYNDANIGNGVIFGTLPNGAMLLSALVRVETAFTASVNVLTLGTVAGSYADIVTASDVTEGTTGTYAGALTNNAFKAAITADTDIGIKYTQSGTAGAAGVATAVVSYAPNNDQ